MLLWLLTALTLTGPGQDTLRNTARLNTTHPSLSLMFEHAGSTTPCAEPCPQYRVWLTFRGHADAAALEATDWRRIADTSCLDLKTKAGSSFLCVITRPVAGRDRTGSDYVLMRFRATLEQIATIAGDPAAKFAIGGVEFQLGRDSRAQLNTWLERLAVR
jgi:hypothetical protein